MLTPNTDIFKYGLGDFPPIYANRVYLSMILVIRKSTENCDLLEIGVLALIELRFANNYRNNSDFF